MSGRPAFGGVILAAGASRRMGGRPKQLLPLDGKPLLQHALDAAVDAAIGEIVLVLGHAADEIGRAIRLPAQARVVVNPRYAEGQSRSLACGLTALGNDVAAAVVLLGDQPCVTSGLVREVTDAFLGAARPAVRPVWTDAGGVRRPGHPVVVARALFSALGGLAGDRGARGLFAAHPEWVHEVALAGTPPADIDDFGDYQRAVGG